MELLHTVGDTAHTLILEMVHVRTMDATGLVALESVLDSLYRARVKVIFAGLTAEVTGILDRAGIQRTPDRLAYAPDVATAISMAIVHAARTNRLDPKAAA
jgi:SulP family sulfate permease